MPISENIEQNRKFSRRLFLLMGAQGLALGGLVARMYQLQVSDSERYTTLAEENRINTRLLLPLRGRIFDRHGRPLAVNEEDYRVVMVAEKTGNVHRALDRLAGIIELKPAERDRVVREVRRRRRFLPVTIATGLTWEEVARMEVNAPDLPGVLTERGFNRVYAYGELVSHLVGYVGPVTKQEQESDSNRLLKIPEFRIGKQGVERTYDGRLRGRGGTQRVEINASGRVQRELGRREGTPGDDLHMTIDMALQRKAMELVRPHRAGSVVVMDIHTGDILAMVSTPGYGPEPVYPGPAFENLAGVAGQPAGAPVQQGGFGPVRPRIHLQDSGGAGGPGIRRDRRNLDVLLQRRLRTGPGAVPLLEGGRARHGCGAQRHQGVLRRLFL